MGRERQVKGKSTAGVLAGKYWWPEPKCSPGHRRHSTAFQAMGSGLGRSGVESQFCMRELLSSSPARENSHFPTRLMEVSCLLRVCVCENWATSVGSVTGASRTLCRFPRLPGSSVFNSEAREFLTSFFLARVHPLHSQLSVPLLVSLLALAYELWDLLSPREGSPAFCGSSTESKACADHSAVVSAGASRP